MRGRYRSRTAVMENYDRIRVARLAAADLLRAIEPKTFHRDGLKETPVRVAKYWAEMTSGYDVDIPALFKTFEDDGISRYRDLVIVSEIPVISSCEHHLVPFVGMADVGYIPNGRVIGLSKLVRVVDAFARRLQVQERLCAQIADAIEQHLGAKGVMVVIRCRHGCMACRGVKADAMTITSAVRGVLETDSAARAEFLALTVPR